MARDLLDKSVAIAIQNKTDFSYETNFNSAPLFWPQKFKEVGYEIHLVFFCLDTIEKAVERVDIRVENGGHYVPKDEIISRYSAGYENLEVNFSYFDSIFIFDTSDYKKPPNPILYFEKNLSFSLAEIPNFILQKLPKLINRFNQLHRKI
jgi:predicted ABC-type ATPase